MCLDRSLRAFCAKHGTVQMIVFVTDIQTVQNYKKNCQRFPDKWPCQRRQWQVLSPHLPTPQSQCSLQSPSHCSPALQWKWWRAMCGTTFWGGRSENIQILIYDCLRIGLNAIWHHVLPQSSPKKVLHSKGFNAWYRFQADSKWRDHFILQKHLKLTSTTLWPLPPQLKVTLSPT